MLLYIEGTKIRNKTKSTPSVLPRNFITGDNVPGHLKKWGHLRKKAGTLCEK